MVIHLNTNRTQCGTTPQIEIDTLSLSQATVTHAILPIYYLVHGYLSPANMRMCARHKKTKSLQTRGELSNSLPSFCHATVGAGAPEIGTSIFSGSPARTRISRPPSADKSTFGGAVRQNTARLRHQDYRLATYSTALQGRGN